MLTTVVDYDIFRIVMATNSIDEPLSEGQARGYMTSRVDGLRVVARIIARHILAERQGKTTSKANKNSMTSRCQRRGSEDLS